jgi:glycosyltransferase involved in cell wall biosynthesis
VALWHMLRLFLRLQRRRRFDVVHASNPPDILFLIALPLKLWGTRFIFDHHDLVPELYESRFPKSGKNLLYRASIILERLTFRTAGVVVTTNESDRAVAIERGRKDRAKVHVSRNGPDLSQFLPVAPDPALKRGKRYSPATSESWAFKT